MHRLKDTTSHNHFSKEQLQTFIKIARQLRPQFEQESAEILKKEYKEMR